MCSPLNAAYHLYNAANHYYVFQYINNGNICQAKGQTDMPCGKVGFPIFPDISGCFASHAERSVHKYVLICLDPLTQTFDFF